MKLTIGSKQLETGCPANLLERYNRAETIVETIGKIMAGS